MILVTVKKPGWVTQRDWRKALKLAWFAAGDHWADRIRPKHFTRKAYQEYDYRKRAGEKLARQSKAFKKSYTGRKLRQHGHTDPLKFSGESEKRTRFAFVQATSNGVKVRMRAPALNFRPKGWPHTLRKELVSVSQKDVDAIGKVLKSEAVKQIKNIQRHRRRVMSQVLG